MNYFTEKNYNVSEGTDKKWGFMTENLDLDGKSSDLLYSKC